MPLAVAELKNKNLLFLHFYYPFSLLFVVVRLKNQSFMASSSSVSENSTTTEQIRYRKPRNQSISPSSNPQISPLLQSSTRCKPTISSFFLSTFINNNSSSMAVSSSLKSKKKKNTSNNNFSSASFRGFGCTTSSQVSAPAVIHSSADWQAKKVRKKKQRKKNTTHHHSISTLSNYPTTSSSSPPVWCSPGIALSTDAASVDCVVSRRPVVQGRGRIDGGGDRMNQRERSCISRRNANLEHITILDTPSVSETTHIDTDVFEARHHRHFRHRSPGGLSEIMMFQSSLLLGGRSDGHDRYRDLRLDVDSMTYEELLELGDKIGYVSTGLREDEISRCLRKTKHSILEALQSHFLAELNRKCSICQEEFEANDDMGKLACGHCYHLGCIKQWLQQKNACPICKGAAMAQF